MCIMVNFNFITKEKKDSHLISDGHVNAEKQDLFNLFTKGSWLVQTEHESQMQQHTLYPSLIT